MMTKAEQRKMERLEIDNRLLRETNNKHIAVYRDNLDEIITLKSKLEMANNILTELCQAMR